MPTAKINGINLYYEVHGEGPAVIFLHGSGGNHVIWWQQVGYFSRKYKAITVDLRGFGKSDEGAGGPDALEFPADVIGLMDHLKIEKAAVVGQSLGATACLRLAVQYPNRMLAVLLCASAGNMSHAELTDLTAADRKKADELEVLDRLMSKDFQQRQPERTWLFQQLGTFNMAGHGLVHNATKKGPTPQEVAASKVPVQFMVGDRDAVLSLKTMRFAHSLVAGSTLTVVPNAPHSLYWEEPAVFNCFVDQYLMSLGIAL